ncbi:hypothetical protein LOD99_8972 [Oopsacas minuta]|uniref:Uncharacterized protein n=1 Tax=Oopsacas minuta TaxID=111878 RepID=A0AAV7JEE6_9METZ|nr:hypothetical protein LOD99_8972 [Oopsacas minuta]
MSNHCPDVGCMFRTAIPAGLPVSATTCPFCQKSLELVAILPIPEDDLGKEDNKAHEDDKVQEYVRAQENNRAQEEPVLGENNPTSDQHDFIASEPTHRKLKLVMSNIESDASLSLPSTPFISPVHTFDHNAEYHGEQPRGENVSNVKKRIKSLFRRKSELHYNNRTRMKQRHGHKRQSVFAIHLELRSQMIGNKDIRIQFNTLILREYCELIDEISLQIYDDCPIKNFQTTFKNFQESNVVEISGFEFNIFHVILKFPPKYISDFPYKYCLQLRSGVDIDEHLQHPSDTQL